VGINDKFATLTKTCNTKYQHEHYLSTIVIFGKLVFMLTCSAL